MIAPAIQADSPLNDRPVARQAFFQGADWAAFGLTSALAWAVYWVTLAPELDLEHSGIFATSALYPGVSEPPGHPLWAVYGWCFLKLWPGGNPAWRLAMASALAGALTCGLVALLVSRLGLRVIETWTGGQLWPSRETRRLRWVCGVVSGMALGLDRCVWREAVVPEPWSLPWLLLALTLCLVTWWMFETPKRRWFYAAAWLCGLTVSETQALLPAVLGLPFMVAAADRKLGRDLFCAAALVVGGVYALGRHCAWHGPMLDEISSVSSWLVWMTVIAAAMVVVLAIRTRGLFTEWKSAALCVALVMAGWGAVLLLPLFSLTNPPMNWGYARSVPGFFNMVSMGQFEALQPTHDLSRLTLQMGLYFQSVRDDLGIIYLLTALVPFMVLPKLTPPVRNWLAGLLVFGLLLGLLTVMGLDSDPDTAVFSKPYFAATHLVIAVLAGCGMMVLGVWFARLSGKGQGITAASGCGR